MNIELQICGLVMLIIFLVLIERDRRLNIKNRLLFIAAFIICMVCLVFDVASIVVIHMAVYEGFSPIITTAVCKIYIMLLVTQLRLAVFTRMPPDMVGLTSAQLKVWVPICSIGT